MGDGGWAIGNREIVAGKGAKNGKIAHIVGDFKKKTQYIDFPIASRRKILYAFRVRAFQGRAALERKRAGFGTV